MILLLSTSEKWPCFLIKVLMAVVERNKQLLSGWLYSKLIWAWCCCSVQTSGIKALILVSIEIQKANYSEEAQLVCHHWWDRSAVVKDIENVESLRSKQRVCEEWQGIGHPFVGRWWLFDEPRNSLGLLSIFLTCKERELVHIRMGKPPDGLMLQKPWILK